MNDELARVKRIGKARKAEERLAVLHELLGHFDNAELLADTHLRAQNAELLAALRDVLSAPPGPYSLERDVAISKARAVIAKTEGQS